MANQRNSAIDIVNHRESVAVEFPALKFSQFFEENTFGLKRMEERLSIEEFKAIKDAMKKGSKIDIKTANAISVAVKNWAVSKGVTHFAHWFQPLTNLTATKHDTFYDSNKKIEQFKGGILLQQEPDGSSFPNGGLRATHQARGYTGWDPTSPMFIYQSTLYIPTVFVSYTGETLDNKSPLLKAQRAVDLAATAVAKLFDYKVEQVFPSLGCEQEYFLVDKALYNARPDLVMTGRTVFGAMSPRGQQQDDHYFGHISERVLDFMKDFEIECMKVGIPVTTRHNEVAPAQFEVAPLYEDINVACDHNSLMMNIMDDIALKHNFKALLHEKPFAGLNGSGKHNNWSLITDTGRNLIDPSFTTHKDGLYFLTFAINTIKAMHDYADVVRGSIASAGNDHRLGANEAPPAIMSVYMGQYLDKILNEFETTGTFKVGKDTKNAILDLQIERIPDLKLDNTDRNRTSPFAFTGNKFELRAVGSTANCAKPMTALNTIVAEQLSLFKDEVEASVEAGEKKDDAIIAVLRRYVTESKAIRFEGDGYSQEWVVEAEKRGLSNVKDTPRALDFYSDEKVNQIFAKHGVYKGKELKARQEVWLENYINKIDIEAGTISDIALSQILPIANEQLSLLIDNAGGLADLEIDNAAAVDSAREVAELIAQVKTGITAMNAERAKISEIESHREQAIQLCDVIKGKYFEEIRAAVDGLEVLVDDAAWPLPKYRELLFLR